MIWIMPTHHTCSVIIAFDDRLLVAPKKKKSDLIAFRYANLSILTEPRVAFKHRCVLSQSLFSLQIYPAA